MDKFFQFLPCGIAGALCVWMAWVPLSAEASDHVSLFAFVQENHKWKPDLKGWTNTARLLEAALKPKSGQVLVDQPPESFGVMMSRPRQAGEYRIVYFATHMHSDGRLFFSNKKQLTPDQLLDQIGGRPVPPDLFIIDCCYAERFSRHPNWNRTFPVPHLYTCNDEQVTWQFEIDTKKPLWIQKYYPSVYQLGERMMGPRSNGKLSYFGLQLLFRLEPNSGEPAANAAAFLRGLALSPYMDGKLKGTRKTSELIWKG